MRSFVITLIGEVSKVLAKLGINNQTEAKNLSYSILGAIYFHIAHWFFNLKDKKIGLKETAKVLFSQYYPYFNQK